MGTVHSNNNEFEFEFECLLQNAVMPAIPIHSRDKQCFFPVVHNVTKLGPFTCWLTRP